MLYAIDLINNNNKGYLKYKNNKDFIISNGKNGKFHDKFIYEKNAVYDKKNLGSNNENSSSEKPISYNNISGKRKSKKKMFEEKENDSFKKFGRVEDKLADNTSDDYDLFKHFTYNSKRKKSFQLYGPHENDNKNNSNNTYNINNTLLFDSMTGLLSDLKLGAHILDTCLTDTRALQQTLKFLKPYMHEYSLSDDNEEKKDAYEDSDDDFGDVNISGNRSFSLYDDYIYDKIGGKHVDNEDTSEEDDDNDDDDDDEGVEYFGRGYDDEDGYDEDYDGMLKDDQNKNDLSAKKINGEGTKGGTERKNNNQAFLKNKIIRYKRRKKNKKKKVEKWNEVKRKKKIVGVVGAAATQVSVLVAHMLRLFKVGGFFKVLYRLLRDCVMLL